MWLPNVNQGRSAGSAAALLSRGTFSHSPEGSLHRIASKEKTEVSTLSTLRVDHTTPVLYNAVAEYVAMYTRDTEHAQLFVDSFEEVKGGSPGLNYLLNNTSIDVAHRLTRRTEEEEEEEAEEEDEETERREDSRTSNSKRLVPKFKFGFGDAEIVWPPPSHLTAESLNASLQAKTRNRGEKEKEKASNVAAQLATSSKNASAAGEDSKQEKPTPQKIHVLHYAVGEPKSSMQNDMTVYREMLLVSTAGQQRLRQFAYEVMLWRSEKDYREPGSRSFNLYRFTEGFGGRWHDEGSKRGRPAGSVVLQGGQLEAILDDVRNFLKPETRKWYFSHGLPQRRSLLFYGPPGTGKTSTVRVIASTFKLNCCFLSMTSTSFSNEMLAQALTMLPSKALIVLEDIDALFNLDRRSENAGGLNFAGLLNALDGLISADGTITVMTTNHIERLDSAMIRGGRVDRRFHFGSPSQEQLQDLFLSFYPDAEESVAVAFSEAVFSVGVDQETRATARSIANLQQLFISQREKNAEQCVAAVPEFFRRYYETAGRNSTAGIYS